MVRSLKRCPRKVLGNARLGYDELLTILLEVEGTHNPTHLTYGYDEVSAEINTVTFSIWEETSGFT